LQALGTVFSHLAIAYIPFLQAFCCIPDSLSTRLNISPLHYRVYCTILYCTSDSAASLKVLFLRSRANTVYQPFSLQLAYILLYIYSVSRVYLRVSHACPTRTMRHYLITALFTRLLFTLDTHQFRVACVLNCTVRDPAPLLYISPLNIYYILIYIQDRPSRLSTA
jgi:hypothetical protein